MNHEASFNLQNGQFFMQLVTEVIPRTTLERQAQTIAYLDVTNLCKKNFYDIHALPFL